MKEKTVPAVWCEPAFPEAVAKARMAWLLPRLIAMTTAASRLVFRVMRDPGIS